MGIQKFKGYCLLEFQNLSIAIREWREEMEAQGRKVTYVSNFSISAKGGGMPIDDDIFMYGDTDCQEVLCDEIKREILEKERRIKKGQKWENQIATETKKNKTGENNGIKKENI